MNAVNDFIANLDFSVLMKYCGENGRSVRYAKGEPLVLEGELCQWMGIVQEGYFKFCSMMSNGQNSTTGFSFKGEAVTDYIRSFVFRKPSFGSIIAGCDSVLLRVPLDDARAYMAEHDPDFVKNTSIVLLEEAYRRYLDMHSKTPAERYILLKNRVPGLNELLPLQEIASFLGISRRQLQRIRESLGEDLKL